MSAWTARNQKPLPPLPKPNGFYTFAVAARAIEGNPGNYWEMSAGQLRTIVDSNQVVIDLVRLGLAQESQVPNSPESGYDFVHIGRSKEITQVLAAASRLAEMEKRYSDAAEMALLGVRFSHESMRGGMNINVLVRVACESIALARLEQLTNVLAIADCHRVVRVLQEVDADRESREDTARNEGDYWRSEVSLRQKLGYMIEQRSFWPNAKYTRLLWQKVDQIDRRRRQLILLFAARTYELEKGRKPARASDLVPEYLDAVPKDPETGRPLPSP
jgi:hypothetical protein